MEGETARRILRLAQVASVTGLARSTIRQKVREQAFPPPVVLSTDKAGRSCQVGWRSDEIQAWIDSRPRSNS